MTVPPEEKPPSEVTIKVSLFTKTVLVIVDVFFRLLVTVYSTWYVPFNDVSTFDFICILSSL